MPAARPVRLSDKKLAWHAMTTWLRQLLCDRFAYRITGAHYSTCSRPHGAARRASALRFIADKAEDWWRWALTLPKRVYLPASYKITACRHASQYAIRRFPRISLIILFVIEDLIRIMHRIRDYAHHVLLFENYAYYSTYWCWCRRAAHYCEPTILPLAIGRMKFPSIIFSRLRSIPPGHEASPRQCIATASLISFRLRHQCGSEVSIDVW